LVARRRLDPDFKSKEKENQRLWRERNREHLRQTYKDFFSENKERRLAQAKTYRSRLTPEQKKEIAIKSAAYREANKARVKELNARWVADNKDYLKQKAKEYNPRRKVLNCIRRQNPVERIKDACRTRTLFILRKAGIPKFNHTFDLIGCTPDFFKSFLEHQFSEGMSWKNFGEWEIDHRIPLTSFDLSDERQKFSAFNYSNCQPLWKPENRSKHDSLPPPHQALLL